MNAPESGTLIDFATRTKTDPRLLHLLVASARRSDSPVIRYGAVAIDEHGTVAGTGYSKMANGEAEERWGDERTPPRLHAEMGALCDAESKGYDVSKLKLYILPLSPVGEKEYIILRDQGEKGQPCFSCSSCGPKLDSMKIPVHIFNGERGFQEIEPEQAKMDGAELARLEAATGRKCRAGSIPNSILTDAPLDAPGYRYIPAELTDMREIGAEITPGQNMCYQEAIDTHGLPQTIGAENLSIALPARGDIVRQ